MKKVGIGICICAAVLFIRAALPGAVSAGRQDAASGGAAASEDAPQAEAERSIGIVVKDNQREFWQRMQKAAQEVCDQNGVELLFLADTSQTDPEGQIRKVDELTDMEVDAICVSPISDEMLIPALRRAADHKIPVFAIDSDSAFSEKTAYIGTDHYEAAKEGAAYAAEIVRGEVEKAGGEAEKAGGEADKADSGAEKASGEAEAVILRGTPGDKVHDDREAGITDALKEAGIIICKTLCSSEAYAEEDAGKLLDMYPDLDMIITTEDGITSGAWEAIRRSGNKHVLLYGFDGEAEVTKLVEQQEQVIGTTAQSPEEIGRICVETVLHYLDGEQITSAVYTPYEIVTDHR